MTFLDKWLETVDRKNSVLCAGLDPAEFAMGRGSKGLSAGEHKDGWMLRYIGAVAPFVAAIKFNTQYWKSAGDDEHGIPGDEAVLRTLKQFAEEQGLLVIDDSKLADIGSTNDAGVFYAAQRADAVTIAPYAGNMGEAAKQAEARGIGCITMCLMSNPEYQREKNMLVPVEDNPNYRERDVRYIEGVPHVKRYIHLAHDANEFGLDGIVIGAPSSKNHIRDGEIADARAYSNPNTLVLLPGLGAQGGEADAIFKHFSSDHVIANVGRALMFPNGASSTINEQAKAAKHYQTMLNELRGR